MTMSSTGWTGRRIRRLARTFLSAARILPPAPQGPDYLEQQVARSWNKEWRCLTQFGVRDGMSILDLGCGPGQFTRRLAATLPAAKLTALDSDPEMLDRARRHIDATARNPVVYVQASGHDTGLPSDSFDVVLARLLFQHLQSPGDVALEAYRVLRPGGRLIVTDIDDGLFGVTQPTFPGLRRVLDEYGRAQHKRGGNRRIGRSLVPLLRAAAFKDVEFEAIAVTSEEASLAACIPQFDPAPLSALVRDKLISQAEHDELRAGYDSFAFDSDAFAMVLLFMACGRKSPTAPGATALDGMQATGDVAQS